MAVSPKRLQPPLNPSMLPTMLRPNARGVLTALALVAWAGVSLPVGGPCGALPCAPAVKSKCCKVTSQATAAVERAKCNCCARGACVSKAPLTATLSGEARLGPPLLIAMQFTSSPPVIASDSQALRVYGPARAPPAGIATRTVVLLI